MTRSRVVGALTVFAFIALVAYVANKSEWTELQIPTPPKGEAITNPFYAAQRFAEALGARTKRLRVLEVPSPGAVIVVSAWHWNLSAQREAALKHWVESGGRLVVDKNLAGEGAFKEWSGIEWDYNDAASDQYYDKDEDDREWEQCGPLEEVTPQSGRTFDVCDRDFTFVISSRPAEWTLRNVVGNQAVRVSIGQGSVTLVNAVPFTHQALLSADHASLFVAATQLHKGDEIIFLTENDHPSLLALMWTYGAPAVLLLLAAVLCYLWRGAARFGPTIGVPEPRRRSMAEQIRGSGYFALTFGEGAALHAAAVRALTEAAHRRIPAYTRLSRPQRATALAKATGLDGDALMSAIDGASKRRPKELPNTLALIESARRQLLHPGT